MIYCIGHTPVGKRKSEVETLIHVFEYICIFGRTMNYLLTAMGFIPTTT